MITKSRALHGISLGELVANLETDGLDAAGSELGLGGVEAAAVSRYHLHDHPVDAALRNLPDHLRCPASSSVASRLRSAGRERKAGRSGGSIQFSASNL
jgi:hypothetical protein